MHVSRVDGDGWLGGDMLTEVLDVARSLRPLARPLGGAVTTVLHILFAEANAGSSHLG
jgi:hypothetical protein